MYLECDFRRIQDNANSILPEILEINNKLKNEAIALRQKLGLDLSIPQTSFSGYRRTLRPENREVKTKSRSTRYALGYV